MVELVSRTGRHLQRYDQYGHRQVVGCIPYRYKVNSQTSLGEDDKFEVLVISSQKKGNGMLFPKGGWETDENIRQAALRETEEEAGVVGILERELGKWYFKSKSRGTYNEGYMFPLLVKEQLESWPEKDARQRTWMSVKEAKEVCQHGWMNEALDVLVLRLKSSKHNKTIYRKSL